MNITLTGATGFIGRHLIAALVARGERLTILTRGGERPGDNPRFMQWDGRSAPPAPAVEADAIVHLAGETVAQRWTPEVKARIRSSRIDTTRALVSALAAVHNKPAVLISASAIGIYGPRGDEMLTEGSPPGSGFLEDLSVEWEREAQRAAGSGIRVVNPRIGVVLGRDGGALEKILPPFKVGAGGRLGTGDQWMSWIHIHDLIGLLLFALDQAGVRGAMNATAPEPVRNAEFSHELGSVLKRPSVVAVPVFALKLMYGEMASVVLASQRVAPAAALQAGYVFRFPALRPALEDLLRDS